MVAHTTTTWVDPSTCPFCEAELVNPGDGFVDHLAESPDCEGGFEIWRRNLADDLAGEWSG